MNKPKTLAVLVNPRPLVTDDDNTMQVSLVLLLGVVCSPLVVFLAFGEQPSVYVIVGGALLLVTLAMHELAAVPGPVPQPTPHPQPWEETSALLSTG